MLRRHRVRKVSRTRVSGSRPPSGCKASLRGTPSCRPAALLLCARLLRLTPVSHLRLIVGLPPVGGLQAVAVSSPMRR